MYNKIYFWPDFSGFQHKGVSVIARKTDIHHSIVNGMFPNNLQGLFTAFRLENLEPFILHKFGYSLPDAFFIIKD
jgi:hypothetical protein